MDGRAHAPARGEGRLLQAILSLAAFAAFAALLFFPAAAYYDESFFGLILSALKGSFIGTGVSRASLYVLVAAYAVMLVCTAASLFCKKKAALAFNYAKGLCMLAAFSFFTGALLYNYGLTLADVFYDPDTFFALNATALALEVCLVYLVALAFTAFGGGYGLVKLLALLIAAAFLLLGLLPFTEGRTLYGVFGFPDLGESALAKAASAALTVYAWGTLVNFGLAALSLALPRRNLLDALRADLLFIVALLAAALYAALEGFDTLAARPGILVGAGLALGQLVYANIFAFRGREKKAAPDAEGEEVPPPDEAPAAPGEPIGELLEAGRAELLEAERAAENARTQPGEPADIPPLPPLPTMSETDNFLDELTSEERAEFERLFVERSFRAGDLPAYVPGGDNRAFFRAVFAYLGAFREEISDGLLEKLDAYCEIRL